MHKPVPLAELLVDVTDDLDRGFDTDQIAANAGVEYESLLTRLRRNGEKGLAKRLMTRRAAEAEPKRLAGWAKWYDRPRCPHGAWSSTGTCEHDGMGRYGTIEPIRAA